MSTVWASLTLSTAAAGVVRLQLLGMTMINMYALTLERNPSSVQYAHFGQETDPAYQNMFVVIMLLILVEDNGTSYSTSSRIYSGPVSKTYS